MSEPGLTIWFTGLSGAGKTTLADAVSARIRAQGRLVEILDGDVVRQNLSAGLGFSKEDRDTNIRRVAFVAELLTRNGVVVIVAAISPYRAVREEARQRIGNFLEVYVRCPLDELVRRDVKGLYRRAIAGEIGNFTGVSDPYEEPEDPDVLVDTSELSVEDAVAHVLDSANRALGDGQPAAAARAPAEVAT
jgi:adenylylsulfate kinase